MENGISKCVLSDDKDVVRLFIVEFMRLAMHDLKTWIKYDMICGTTVRPTSMWRCPKSMKDRVTLKDVQSTINYVLGDAFCDHMCLVGAEVTRKEVLNWNGITKFDYLLKEKGE